MGRTPAEKWLQGASPDDPAVDVARRALRSRLTVVSDYLPLAATRADEDVEYVHQLRVWARRATAAVRLFADLLPRRRLWLLRQLRRIRRAADEARNADVLLARLEDRPRDQHLKRWRKRTRRERAEAQAAIVAVYKRLSRRRRFVRRIDALLQRVRSRHAEDARFGDWAAKHLGAAAERFFAAVPTDQADEEALHRLRIRGKELRYAVELLAGAFPDALRPELYPLIESMQDRLGHVNDLATACANLSGKLQSGGSWRRLLRDEQAKLELARREFWQWCTPQLLRQLREGFEELSTRPMADGAGPGRGAVPFRTWQGEDAQPEQAASRPTGAVPGAGDGSAGPSAA